MERIRMNSQIRADDIEVSGPAVGIKVLSESDFFTLRDSRADTGDIVPLPNKVDFWSNGKINNVNVLVSMTESDLFVIANDIKIGYALFHYVYDSVIGGRYVWSKHLPFRPLKIERSTKEMPVPTTMPVNLAELAKLNPPNVQMRSGEISQMNLGYNPTGAAMSYPQTPMNVGGGAMGGGSDGVTEAIDVSVIQHEALGYGYVAGYVMQDAPRITVSVSHRQTKSAGVVDNIVAKESKPSKIIRVLVALPARCVCNNNGLASPDDIAEGKVNYSTIPQNEMVYLPLEQDAATAYIGALGNRLPEYAPNTVPNAKEQWPADVIWSKDPNVNFVYVVSVNRHSNSNSKERFHFTLKTTSPRRSLFSTRNHVCLRALEHISTECNTEEQAYYLNESAFGGWRYLHRKNESKTNLERAIQACPGQIWEKKYMIDGKEVEGIGSAFFMAGMEEHPAGSAEPIIRRELTCYRWNQTGVGEKRGSPVKVPAIVKKRLKPAEGNRKEGMVNIPIYYKDDRTNKAFEEYGRFVKYAIEKGYFTQSGLDSLGSRTSSRKTKSFDFTPEVKNALRSWMSTDSVASAIAQSRQRFMERSLINERGSSAI